MDDDLALRLLEEALKQQQQPPQQQQSGQAQSGQVNGGSTEGNSKVNQKPKPKKKTHQGLTRFLFSQRVVQAEKPSSSSSSSSRR